MWNGELRNFVLTLNNGRYTLEKDAELSFLNIETLIEHYHKNLIAFTENAILLKFSILRRVSFNFK